MTIIICGLPDWRTNDVEGEVIESIKRSSGLWSRCTYYNTGNWQCDHYDTFFLGLPGPLQCARACVCIAITFQSLATLAAFVGMECTTLLPSYDVADPEGRNKAVKKKIMVGVGALNVISGAILCVGVSYFASTVLQEYNGMNGLIMRGSGSMSSGSQRSATGERYVYGQCLFIGWGAMIIDIVGGAIILCGSCGSSHSVGTESFYGTQGRLMSNQYAPNVDNIVNKWKTNPQQKDGSVNGQQYI